MAMINLKREPEPEEAEGGTMLAPSWAKEAAQPAYPWGLKIRLEDEELDALSMPMPTVGTTMTITCKVQVVSVRQEQELETGDDSMERCVELQITDMDLGVPPTTTREQRMYRS